MSGGTTGKVARPSAGAEQVPTLLLDAVVIEEVPIALWQKVFTQIGYPPGIKPADLSHDAILEHVQEGKTSPELIEVLQAIHDLGTDAGADAVKAVAAAHQLDLGAIIKRSPREGAVELWLAQRQDAALREVYTRIQMQAEARREPRSFREFRGRAARPLLDWKKTKRRLADLVAAWCGEEGFGDHIDVRGYTTQGDARIQVIHGHRLQRPVVVKDGGPGRAAIQIRPVHCDIIRYDASAAWLRLSPRSAAATTVERYRRVIGEAFFDDPEFFGKDIACTLRPLQERGQQALDDSRSVASARVTELLWERGDDQLWLKSADCFTAASQLGVPLIEGEFIEAKIGLTLIGRRPVRRTLHVKPPNRIDYPRDIYESAIDEFLASTGVRQTAALQPERDLWSLFPWKHPETAWRDAYARDVDELVRHQALARTPLLAVHHPDHEGAGRALRVEQPGDFGMSTDPDVPPRQLTPSDVEGLALDAEKLGELWRGSLALEGQLRDLGDGAYLLGHRLLDAISCALVLLTRQPTADPAVLGQLIRSSAPGQQVGLLLPSGRTSGTGLVEIQFASLLPAPSEIWRAFVAASGLAERLPATWSAPAGACLVVDRRSATISIDGITLGLAPGTHGYVLLETLADAHGAVVSHDEIAAKVSVTRRDEAEVVSRKAKSAAKKAIVAAFKSARRQVDPDDIIRQARGGYRLGVQSHVA